MNSTSKLVGMLGRMSVLIVIFLIVCGLMLPAAA